jgi:hypothetical protein
MALEVVKEGDGLAPLAVADAARETADQDISSRVAVKSQISGGGASVQKMAAATSACQCHLGGLSPASVVAMYLRLVPCAGNSLSRRDRLSVRRARRRSKRICKRVESMMASSVYHAYVDKMIFWINVPLPKTDGPWQITSLEAIPHVSVQGGP